MKTNDKKLPFKVKLSVAIGGIGNNILVLLNTYFLLYVYTDVIQIPAAAATVIMLVARIWDAVNDPMMGAIVDRTKSKEGKARFWLKYFSFPAIVIIVLSYWCPNLPVGAKIAWVAVSYIAQGMVHTALGIPGSALIAAMTDSRQERIQIEQFSMVGSTVLNLVIPSMTLPMVKAVGGTNLSLGFLVVVGVYAVVYGVSKFICYLGSAGWDEVYDPEAAETQENDSVPQTQSFFSMLKEALKNRFAVITSLTYLGYLLIAATMGTTLVYYFQYVVGDTGMLSYYSVAVSIGGVAAIFGIGFMSKKWGNAMSGFLCGVIVIIALGFRWVTGDTNIPVFIVAMAFAGYASSLVGTFCYQCMLDACTYGRLTTGNSNQATLMSLFSFAQKAGQALGSVIAAGLLSLVPYVPQAEEQADSVKTLFFFENIPLPMILAGLMMVGFVFVSRYEKKLDAILAAEKKKAAETVPAAEQA